MKLVIPIILLVISLQVWFVRELYRLDANDKVRGNEVRIMRERVKNVEAQFQDIIYDVAYRKALDMIKQDRLYK